MVSEQHPHFPSGEWEGHYNYVSGPNASKHPMSFQLNFAAGHVTGHGSDDVGSFTWRGHYDTQTLVVQMTKQYRGAHEVFYDGRADSNGIYGSWRMTFTRGGFHVWPKKPEEETKEVVVDEKVLTPVN